jgi:hypothetical protein
MDIFLQAKAGILGAMAGSYIVLGIYLFQTVRQVG